MIVFFTFLVISAFCGACVYAALAAPLRYTNRSLIGHQMTLHCQKTWISACECRTEQGLYWSSCSQWQRRRVTRLPCWHRLAMNSKSSRCDPLWNWNQNKYAWFHQKNQKDTRLLLVLMSRMGRQQWIACCESSWSWICFMRMNELFFDD